jgi:hypothetical protein
MTGKCFHFGGIFSDIGTVKAPSTILCGWQKMEKVAFYIMSIASLEEAYAQ